MKKLILVLCTAAFISVTLLSSCKKYVDGPAFSLRSKKSRLAGDWTVESFSVNNVDKTEEFKTASGSNYKFIIEKKGSYKITGNTPDEGTWELGEDKDDIYLHSNTPGSEELSFRILRLANKELWLRQVLSNGVMNELKLKQ